MFESKAFTFAVGLVFLFCLARPAAAFGAGNIASISKIEGQNWRHGDIEDALLRLAMAKAFGGKKFTKHNVSRVYFGNWLRDYSQAIDVGTVKSVSAEAIRLLLCVLGFMTFGYGSNEFEVTTERLGCYRPEEHIDNPKNYADNVDARQYHRALRGPVDESVELAIDEQTGMKNYIANDNVRIMTSSRLCRDLFTRCIELGRSYARSGNKAERNEALRLMGTGLHCLEDFFAHSNYTELALIELGERDVFPHVGRNTQIRIPDARGSVYPIVTGTFGGVDFLHSVTGEVSDKLTQNEIEELEGALQETSKADTSILRSLLDKIPDSVFGGKSQSGKVEEIQANANSAQFANMNVSPREPEEYTLYCQDIFKQIMPVIEWHDNIMKDISNAISKIPVLPQIMGQLEEQMTAFIFSVIAPFILPVIRQIRSELKTGSEEIISSSEREQHIVFNDDDSTDPTHSMLAKDHFSNILNEVAGRCAAYTVQWVVPQIMEAIDDESVDVNRLIDRITSGILAHPAQRESGRDGASEGRKLLFRTVEEWWGEKGGQQDEYRRKLSRRGVQNGDNHKEGVHDTGHGHGCVGKLKMRKQFGEPETWEDKVAEQAAGHITGAISNMITGGSGSGGGVQKAAEGGLGGLIGGIASSLLGGGGSESKREDSGYSGSSSSRRRDDDDHRQSQTTSQYSQSSYSQSTASSRQHASGGYGSSSGYGQRDEQDSYGSGRQQSSYGGDSERQGGYHQSSYGRSSEQQSSYQQSGYGGRDSERQSGYQQSSYGGRDSERQGGYQQSSYGGRDSERQGGYQQSSYGGRDSERQGGYQQSSYGGRDSDSRDDYGGGSRYQGGNQGYGQQQQQHRRKDSSDDDDDDRKKYGHQRKKSDDDDRRQYGHQRKKSDDDERRQYGHQRKKSDDDERRGGHGSDGIGECEIVERVGRASEDSSSESSRDGSDGGVKTRDEGESGGHGDESDDQGGEGEGEAESESSSGDEAREEDTGLIPLLMSLVPQISSDEEAGEAEPGGDYGAYSDDGYDGYTSEYEDEHDGYGF